MRYPPPIPTAEILSELDAHYGLRASSVEYLPIGYDLTAWAFRVSLPNGDARFLKVRTGEPASAGLLLPLHLREQGICGVLAPIRTTSSRVTAPLGAYCLTLYPFLEGDNAMVRGMSQPQWRAFGKALRAVHDSVVPKELEALLPVDRFDLPSARAVRQILGLLGSEACEGGVAERFAAFLQERRAEIENAVAMAESLASGLQKCDFHLCACHSDIHAANVFVGVDGEITLVDWDSPLLAPRERDLIFIIGSDIARTVEPHEEQWFFEGYGAVEVDWKAFAFYRLERSIEDLAEWGRCVFLTDMSEEAKWAEADFAIKAMSAGMGLAPWLDERLQDLRS